MTVTSALHQVWPAFALVAGLLLIGAVAYDDGLFDAIAAWLARLPGGGFLLFSVSMALVTIVTVVLTLDSAVVFVTPVLYLTARRRGLNPGAFLYGTVFMSNAASLLLPGSNLTNLIVLSSEHISGTRFAVSVLPAWVVSTVATAVVVALVHRNDLAADPTIPPTELPERPFFGLGFMATVAATTIVLLLREPALPSRAGARHRDRAR